MKNIKMYYIFLILTSTIILLSSVFAGSMSPVSQYLTAIAFTIITFMIAKQDIKSNEMDMNHLNWLWIIAIVWVASSIISFTKDYFEFYSILLFVTQFLISILWFIRVYIHSNKNNDWIWMNKFIWVVTLTLLLMFLLGWSNTFNKESLMYLRIEWGATWTLILFSLFWFQHAISNWKFLWEWDVILSIPLWLLLSYNFWYESALEMFLITYVSASVFYLWQKIINQEFYKTNVMNKEISFWQFIIFWFYIEMLTRIVFWTSLNKLLF